VRPCKIVIDTNIWISYLIGKRLDALTDLLSSGKFRPVVSSALLDELRDVALRPSIKKYIRTEALEDFITFLESISLTIEPTIQFSICRDPEDDFILALAKEAGAQFILTGDKDLLTLDPFGKIRILTFNELLSIFPV